MVKTPILKQYGNWTTIKEITNERKGRYVLCKCACGVQKEIRLDLLKAGRSKQCKACAAKERNTTHGDTGSRLHTIWMGIANRCRFNSEYTNIERCKEWDNYTIFKQWYIANGYTDTATIDRKNNTKGYTPDNCRWTTKTVQAENRRHLFINNTSKYRGVSFHKASNKWRAYIKINDKHISLGYHKTKEKAALAYNTYVELHNLNRTLNSV